MVENQSLFDSLYMKFDLTAIELDKDYYEQAKQRLINHQRQLTLF